MVKQLKDGDISLDQTATILLLNLYVCIYHMTPCS